MEIRQYKVGKFEEWDKKTQVEILKKYRDINVDYPEWADCILDGWKLKLMKMGYKNPDILWSGFVSQGDGACFEADIDIRVWLKYHKIRSALLTKFADRITARLKNSGRYLYASSTYLSYEIDMQDEEAAEKFDTIDQKMAEIEEEILKDRLEIGNKIYKELDKLYWELLSDDNVRDTLIANDYLFTEDGDID